MSNSLYHVRIVERRIESITSQPSGESAGKIWADCTYAEVNQWKISVLECDTQPNRIVVRRDHYVHAYALQDGTLALMLRGEGCRPCTSFMRSIAQKEIREIKPCPELVKMGVTKVEKVYPICTRATSDLAWSPDATDMRRLCWMIGDGAITRTIPCIDHPITTPSDACLRDAHGRMIMSAQRSTWNIVIELTQCMSRMDYSAKLLFATNLTQEQIVKRLSKQLQYDEHTHLIDYLSDYML